MKIDITLKITPKMVTDAQGNEKKSLVGHLGTHFDVMNKEFPLEYTERKGIVFDVSSVENRDIDITDIDMNKVIKNMFYISDKRNRGANILADFCRVHINMYKNLILCDQIWLTDCPVRNPCTYHNEKI